MNILVATHAGGAARALLSSLVLFLALGRAVHGAEPASHQPPPALVDTNRQAVAQAIARLEKASADADAAIERWLVKGRSIDRTNDSALAELDRRIQNRLAEVDREYQDLVAGHPRNDAARVAYAGFLAESMRAEEQAQDQLETALTITTNNPDVYNNLANIYGHIGSVRQAFDFYERAIALNPAEPVYFHNFGTTVFLFRTDVREHYGINEQQVFDKALGLYDQAMRLDPTNYTLACDVALTYYGITPRRTEAALVAWTNALRWATTPVERESVEIHLARVKLLAGRLEEARAHLHAVTNQAHLDLRRRLERNLRKMSADPSLTDPS